MFGFVTDLVNSVTGNSGSKSPTSGAKAGLTDAVKNIGAGSEQRAGQNNVQGSNAAAGYTGGGAAGGQPGGTELDVTRITSDPEVKKNKEVGTSVNVDNPNGGKATSFRGFPSLFNPYYLVRYHAMTNDSESQSYITDLNSSEGSIEYKGMAEYEQYKNPSTSLIISHYSNGPGADQPERNYSYSDFLYLKEYHPFNNNRLITLRRFMAPVYDELRVAIKSEQFDSPLRKPIAQALTYLDTSGNKLSAFTKMTVSLNTTKVEGAGTTSNEAIVLKEAENFIKGTNGTATGDAGQAGIIEAVVLPKESEGLFKYTTENLNQLHEAIEFCKSKDWNVNEDNFIHLGFWRTHEILDSSECVWGLDVESMEDNSNLLSSTDVVILPIGILLNLGDSIAAAAGLKLLLKMHTKVEKEK